MPVSVRSLVQTLLFTVVVPDFTFTTTQVCSGVQHEKAVPSPLHSEYMKSLDCLHLVVELVEFERRLAMNATLSSKLSADTPHAAARTNKAL